MKNQKHDPDQGLDALLVASGPQILDRLNVELPAEKLLGPDASETGVALSLRPYGMGVQVDSVGPFSPGLDHIRTVDIRASYASDRVMAKKVLRYSSPSRLHVVADLSDRQDILMGDYAARNMAMFMVSLCGQIAKVTESEIAVYAQTNDRSGLLYEGVASDLYDAFNQLDGKITPRPIIDSSPTLAGLTELVQKEFDEEHDAAFVISDFMDGYSDSNSKYDWNQPLSTLKNKAEDRLWITRITSPSQWELFPAVVPGMSLELLQRTNNEITPIVERQNAVIDTALKGVRVVEIDTMRANNPKHPVKMMTDFMLGRV